MNDAPSLPAAAELEDPGPFVLDQFVPYFLNRITNRLNKDLTDALRAIGLSVPQWRVISVLTVKDGRSLSELAVYTIIDQSTLSRVIDRMEAADLVKRKPRADDGRFIEVWLTRQGAALFDVIWPVAAQQYRNAVHGIDADELDAFIDTLHKILANIRRSSFQ